MLTALLLVSSLALADLPPQAVAAGLTAQDWAQLEKGEAVSKSETYKNAEGKDAGRGRAWIIVNATPEACYDTLHRYDVAQYMPRVKKVTFVEKGETAMKVVQEIKVALSTYRYTMKFSFDPAKKEMSWVLDHSVKNDIADTTGGWKLSPLEGGKTFVDYNVAADTGMAVPRFLSDYFTKKDLPDVLASFKKRVESGNKWTRD